jgi:hypothetical protein
MPQIGSTNDDKRRSVDIMVNDRQWVKLSDGEIARHCAVTQQFVSKRRASYNHRPRHPQSSDDGLFPAEPDHHDWDAAVLRNC